MGEKPHKYQPVQDRGGSEAGGHYTDGRDTPVATTSSAAGSSYDVEEADRALGARERDIARREKRITRLLQFNIILLVASICFFSSRLVLPAAKLDMHECAKLLSPASPLLEHVKFTEGDFTNYFNHTSKYRGPPSKELEGAWLALWDLPPIGVDDQIVKDLNKTEAKHVQIIGSDPEKPTYAAMVEVFHQLHCLNLVRQATWPLNRFDKDWGYKLYPSDLEDELAGRMHVDHCIETLRLSLMCYGDVTPVLLDHRTDNRHSVPRELDFNVHHKCRDFDQLVDWTLDNYVTVEDLGDGI